jgi:O-antigen/teichoic acid export membrane protein
LTETDRQDQQDIVRGFGANFLGFLAKFGARAPFLFVAGSLYGSNAFGRYVIIIAIIETLSNIASFGLKRSLFKFLDDDAAAIKGCKPEATIAAAVILAVSVGLLFAVPLFFFADQVSVLINEPGDALPIRFLCPMIPLAAFADVILASTRFRRTVRFEVMARSVIEPMTLMLSSFLFYFLGLKQFGLFFAYGLSILGAVTVAVYGVARVFSLKSLVPGPRLFRRIVGMIKFSGPTAFNDLVTILLFRVDVFIISHFCTRAELGIYGMAQQFATSAQKIHESFNPIVAPVVSSLIARGPVIAIRHQLAQVSRWIFSLQLVIVIGIVFYGATLLTIVGSNYAAGGMALTFLVLAEMVNGSFGVSDLPLLFKRPALNPIVTSFGFAVQAALCFILVPRIGITGAALSLALTYFLMNLTRILLLLALFRVLILEWTLLRPIAVGILTALAISLLRFSFPLAGWPEAALGVPATLIIYGALMLLFGLNSSEKMALSLKFPTFGRFIKPAQR